MRLTGNVFYDGTSLGSNKTLAGTSTSSDPANQASSNSNSGPIAASPVIIPSAGDTTATTAVDQVTSVEIGEHQCKREEQTQEEPANQGFTGEANIVPLFAEFTDEVKKMFTYSRGFKD